jgi:hypothetical protein
MSLSQERKCLNEIIDVLAKYGFNIPGNDQAIEKKKISVEEEALKKIKRIFGILKNYEKSSEEVLRNKYAGLAIFLGVSNKLDNISQCKEIFAILGDFEDITLKNAECKINEVIDYFKKI